MMGATRRPQTGEAYMDSRINKLGPRWGWTQRCMPGFGRTAVSLPSVHFSNFSNVINASSLPHQLEEYRFVGTVFSNASGEHLRVGIDIGLAVWSVIPVQNSSGDLTNIAFLATPPVRERDLWMLSSLKHDQNGTIANTPQKLDDSTSSNFECVIYTGGVPQSLAATKTIASSRDLVSLSCDTSQLSRTVKEKLVSPNNDDVVLALHDLDLNLYWNFSKPCFPVTLDPSSDISEPKSVVTSETAWKVDRDAKRSELTAVIIIRNETKCFLVEWLESMTVLGFNRVIVYKRQTLNGNVDEVDRILLKYVRRGLVSVFAYFDSQDRCDESIYLDVSQCSSFKLGYKILFQDAMWRFPSNWTLAIDADEMIILPRLQTSSSNRSITVESPDAIKSSLLQALNSASINAGTHTKEFGFSQVSFGTGPKRPPLPSCPAVCSSIVEGMLWRAEHALPSHRRFVKDGHFPYLQSAPKPNATESYAIGRIHPTSVVIHRYLRAYQGALPEHNQVMDDSTQAYGKFLQSRSVTSKLESC